MKVCIVGATGVLGRALIPLLLSHGHHVRAIARFTRLQQSVLPPSVECVRYDLLSPDNPLPLSLHISGCDAVIHAATDIPANVSDGEAWKRNTRLRTEGTRHLIEASLEAGVRIYVQQSISLAYPDMGDEWIGEDTPLDESPARAGVCAPVISMEALVRRLLPGAVRWSILRGGMFVGKGTRQDELVRRLRTGQERIVGDGRNFVSPVHVADMATAVMRALENAPRGSVFNVNAEPVRFGDYLKGLAERVQAPVPARSDNGVLPPSQRCDNTRVRLMLDWESSHSIYP